MKLYAMPSSGNSYKVRVLLALLDLPHTVIPSEAGSPGLAQAKALSPMGKVPVLVQEDGTVVTDSNAILLYLARGTAWLPDDPRVQARVHSWLFWEQNRHEPAIAVRAGNLAYPGRGASAAQMAALLSAGQEALGVMDRALASAPYLAGHSPTVADIALYAYTHTADTRGGFDLSQLPALRDWLDRVAAVMPPVDLPQP